MSTTAAVPKPDPKPNPNALLLFWRKIHTWIGLTAGLFLITVAITGIYLNHKDAFGRLLGFKKPEKESMPAKEKEKEKEKAGGGIPVSDLATLPVSFANALTTASAVLDDAPVERIELKAENGGWVYKVKATTGQEVVIDAVTGAMRSKGNTKANTLKPQKGHKDTLSTQAPSEAKDNPEHVLAANGEPKRMDWGKAIKDLHTGKIAGDAGKLLVDLVAVVLVVLTLSGLYLWVVPTLRKRRSARLRAAATSPAPALSQGTAV